MKKEIREMFTELDGQKFYKIENYDLMDDFFMTLTSSSDVWNFLWSKGGITAGRKNADNAIFQYATCDKVSDFKYTTGSYTLIAVEDSGKTVLWEPFSSLINGSYIKNPDQDFIQYNIYKSINGSKIWFEEVNSKLNLAFRYGWTSSSEYGLVKMTKIVNLGSKRNIKVLDGARNLMPSVTTSGMQINNSVLLDAYKKADIYTDYNIGLFSLSSAVSDKAEPCENLVTNTCWFTTEDKIYIQSTLPQEFVENLNDLSKIERTLVVKGQRPSCYIIRNIELSDEDSWFSVFDVGLNAVRLSVLKNAIKDRAKAKDLLLSSIDKTENLLEEYIRQSDGVQSTNNELLDVHHRTNVMFNIMRGGIFNDDGKINTKDFISFVESRNKDVYNSYKSYLADFTEVLAPQEFASLINKTENDDLYRLFLEYLPVKFSRRHGDPSRPWNRFNIELKDKNDNEILNYEGNWRDIFQNWEALLYSYPEYVSHVTAKFVNAMTIDGYNPYRISRAGIDWECPEEGNPWAQYGYWGDHQVIYLQKLLELFNSYDKELLYEFLSKNVFSTANVPYRLKSYEKICENPRESLTFDKKLSDKLFADAEIKGNDYKLVVNNDGKIAHVNLTSKLLQILISKICSLVPGGGFWMNTQRPEWNDANNALAGWGLSVVTVCYMNRMVEFLEKLYEADSAVSYMIPVVMKNCIKNIIDQVKKSTDAIYTDNIERKAFVDGLQTIFEEEVSALYSNAFNDGLTEITKAELKEFFTTVGGLLRETIRLNKTEDGLYNSYNILVLNESGMSVKYLYSMLEGQVAVLSSGLLKANEVIELCRNLKTSPLYEERQNSYLLYPNRQLPCFFEKNKISAEDAAGLEEYLLKDEDGSYHFNEYCQNSRLLNEWLDKKYSGVSKEIKVTLEKLYEKTFNHSSFTGRSGTFYAYEGLGSIYWHMVSKLLLAVEENSINCFKQKDKAAEELKNIYYELKKGLGAYKSSEIYGAFPFDPYSHTPHNQGAKQPGMTGQVKEEVLTRWNELGVSIEDGCACFNPYMLLRSELIENGYLSFTWCGVSIKYVFNEDCEEKATVYFADNSFIDQPAEMLSKEISEELFCRSGIIKEIIVQKRLQSL